MSPEDVRSYDIRDAKLIDDARCSECGLPIKAGDWCIIAVPPSSPEKGKMIGEAFHPSCWLIVERRLTL